MILVNFAVAGLALGVALFAALRVVSRTSGVTPAPMEAYDDTVLREAVETVVAGVLEVREEYGEWLTWKGDIEIAVAEGIKHVERAENRIKSTVRRAKQQLAEHGLESPGLEAESAELRVIDGGGGAQSELPAVPTEVVGPRPTTLVGVPGDWTPEELRVIGGQ